MAPRTSYGYWLAAAGAGAGPFTVRLTDSAGHHRRARIRRTARPAPSQPTLPRPNASAELAASPTPSC